MYLCRPTNTQTTKHSRIRPSEEGFIKHLNFLAHGQLFDFLKGKTKGKRRLMKRRKDVVKSHPRNLRVKLLAARRFLTNSGSKTPKFVTEHKSS